ncbi:HD domain-containing protein [Streptomyces doebereineriae]|uniref:HD domain-containing protein n=1 Tax=Streptomyces doebereineriae TaxID=3075528 RepID=A0ABU2VG32_9ACTN|nr:HD domain-containing protein [Streptomyces sp. DSM 41640]MDT0484526.1 HD domain-containing protein [Streptomyces sp. DSM 41640]
MPTNVVGLCEVFTDPLWRISVHLTPVEVDLLRSEPLRRLHFIAHGGASTISTLQSYSRLEHSLGVLALVSHFRRDDQVLRVAALVHDIGHLPLSHTFEGVADLNHHAIGTDLLQADPVRAVLARHGISTDAVVTTLDKRSASPLSSHSSLLNLDHLDSYVRSGRFSGRLNADPAVLLDRLEIKDAAVSTDRETAGTLVDLVCAEARLHTSWDNVGPVSVVRRLVCRLLDGGAADPYRLARMTDPQLWSAFDSLEATRAEGTMLRYELHRLKVVSGGVPDDPSAWDYALRKIYSSAPLIDGERLEVSAPELAAELDHLRLLPTRFRVWWA